jgi:putative transposase
MNGRSGQHHRHSLRLRGYDYAQPGAYFVTICTQDRACLFGAVVDGEMLLNEMGEIVRGEWFRTAYMRPYVQLNDHEFVIMPNHIHGIIWIVDSSIVSGAEMPAETSETVGAQRRCAPTSPVPIPTSVSNVPPGSLGAIIRSFKSAVTKRINEMRRTRGAPVWQRNYYEHIIRNEESLTRIRQYIVENPLRWHLDRENPDRNTPEHRTSATRAPR